MDLMIMRTVGAHRDGHAIIEFCDHGLKLGQLLMCLAGDIGVRAREITVFALLNVTKSGQLVQIISDATELCDQCALLVGNFS